ARAPVLRRGSRLVAGVLRDRRVSGAGGVGHGGGGGRWAAFPREIGGGFPSGVSRVSFFCPRPFSATRDPAAPPAPTSFLWPRALFGNTILWGRRRYQLLRDGRFRPAA